MNSQIFLNTVSEMNNFTISNMQLDRQDWLFPSDPAVFSTNPLSVAYGAMGVLYGLKKTSGKVPKSAINWVLEKSITNDNYPPGLYIGLSGIAWVFWDLGFKEIAIKFMNDAEKHPLLWKSADIFSGASGYGMACIRFFIETKDSQWLERAVHVGEWLLNKHTRIGENKNYCMDSNGQTYLGYARGNSGVALFLLYLYQTTGEIRFYEAGEAALLFDLSYLQETPEGHLSIARGEINNLEKVFTHYWLDGSAGISSVLLRYWFVTGDRHFYDIFQSLIPDSFRKITAFPSFFRGSAGLGNVLLDAYFLTKEDKFLNYANEIGNGILLFKIQRNNGVAFPGEQLLRISTDYGTGMAGISLYLHRLADSNNIGNFNFMLDQVLKPINETERIQKI